MTSTRPRRRRLLACGAALALLLAGCASSPRSAGAGAAAPVQHGWEGLPGPQWYLALPVLLLWEGLAFTVDAVTAPVLVPTYHATGGDQDLALPVTRASEEAMVGILGVDPPPE